MVADDCDNGSCELLVSPLPTKRPQPLPVLLRPEKRRVVMVDSRKPGSSQIFLDVKQRLENKGIEVGKGFEKRTASLPLNESELSQFSSEQGLVLCGVGD